MLQASEEERFRFIANAAPVMIWMSDVNAQCTYVNQSWLDLTGRTLDAELGSGWTALVHPDDLPRIADSWRDSFDRRERCHGEFRLRRHDGEYRWFASAGVPRYNEDGTFAGYIGSASDVTERKLAEDALSTLSQRLIEAQEDERKRLAGELHDDVTQRLGLLAWHLDDLVENAASLPPDMRDRIAHARQEVRQLSSDLRDLSHRLHPPRLEFLGLAAAAAVLCETVAEQTGVHIDCRVEDVTDDLSPRISLCLFRVLQEALQNAAKHSGARRLHVQLRGDGGYVELTVRDDGAGFDPMEAARSRGLGLTSMKERLKGVDGDLLVESAPQRGTTVRARVPLVRR